MDNFLGVTTLNESKKLIELGMDVDTADFYYHSQRSSHDTEITEVKINYGKPKCEDDTPAWGLTSLLNFLFKTNDAVKIVKTDNEFYAVSSTYASSAYEFMPNAILELVITKLSFDKDNILNV